MKKSKKEIIAQADMFDKAIIAERKHRERRGEDWEAPMPTSRAIEELYSGKIGGATDGAALSDALYLQRTLPRRPQEELDDMKTMLAGLGETDDNPWDADVQERKDLLRYRSADAAADSKMWHEKLKRWDRMAETSGALMERSIKNDPDISKNTYRGLSQRTLPSDFIFRQ